MNPSDNIVVIYPRTKVGTFNTVADSDVHFFDYLEEEPKIHEEAHVLSSHLRPNINNETADSSHAAAPTQSQVNEILDKVDLSNDNLSSVQEGELRSLLADYASVFQTTGSPLGHYSKVKHVINTGDHPPVRVRPYRHPPHLQKIIREQVEQMLKDKIISPSTSCWSSNIVLVRKKGSNDFRFCLNFKPLNLCSLRDNFPLPNILDSLDSLGATNPAFFSTLDMASGYWQIGLEESSKCKTAFVTQEGLF